MQLLTYQLVEAIDEGGGHELLPVGLKELLVELIVNSAFRFGEQISGKSAALCY